MEVAIINLVAFGAGLCLGASIGMWYGYSDAQPRRDKRGRFTKRK
jgi:hypothetical protein